MDSAGSAIQIAITLLRDIAAIERVLRALLTEAAAAGLQEHILAGVLFKSLSSHPLLHSSSFR